MDRIAFFRGRLGGVQRQLHMAVTYAYDAEDCVNAALAHDLPTETRTRLKAIRRIDKAVAELKKARARLTEMDCPHCTCCERPICPKCATTRGHFCARCGGSIVPNECAHDGEAKA